MNSTAYRNGANMNYTTIDPNKVYSMDDERRIVEKSLHFLPKNILRISKSLQLARAVLVEHGLRESAITTEALAELMEGETTINTKSINFIVGLLTIHFEYNSFDFDQLMRVEMVHVSHAIIQHFTMTA